MVKSSNKTKDDTGCDKKYGKYMNYQRRRKGLDKRAERKTDREREERERESAHC